MRDRIFINNNLKKYADENGIHHIKTRMRDAQL